MDIWDLDCRERGLIEIIRAFKFLRQVAYHETEISIAGRSNPSVIYKCLTKNRIVRIIGDESPSWAIIIQRKRLFGLKQSDFLFEISDYYNLFGSGMVKGRSYTLKSQAEFIQQHLMPVIKGEVWIDELIKQRRVTKFAQ